VPRSLVPRRIRAFLPQAARKPRGAQRP